MKKKMLLLGSSGAVLLSTLMLIMPASASVTAGCSSKSCQQNSGILLIEACQPVKNEGCVCPLPHPTFNGCLL